MKGRKLIAVVAVGVLLAIIGGAMFPLVDYIVKEQIKQKVIIANTSELYDVWQDVPVPVYMQFYIFTVENVQEIKDGEKPFVTQKGPYTYRERRIKFNIVWNDNGTVTYRQNRTFQFIRNMSVGPDTDMITTVNPLIAVIAQGMRNFPSFVRTALSQVLNVVSGEQMFMTRPVHEVLFGYDDPALVMMKGILPTWFETTQIGYFIRRNYTDDGLYTVATGAKDITELGGITRYNGLREVDIWTTKWARMVNGTDGTVGPPFRFTETISPVFVSDLCRSIRGVYRGATYTPQGIELRRFGGDPYDMANYTVNPDNIGFCTPQSKCLPTGLLNSTLCQEPVDGFPLPVIFSFPHFLYADPEVQNSVSGMNPSKKEHDTLIDVEPWTGLVLQAAKRLQINMYVERVEGIEQTYNIRTLYFPILWLNESSVVDDTRANMLKDQLFTPMLIAKVIKISLLCLGGVLIIVGGALLARQKYKLHKTNSRTSNGDASRESTGPSRQAPVSYSDPIGETYRNRHTRGSNGASYQIHTDRGSVPIVERGSAPVVERVRAPIVDRVSGPVVDKSPLLRSNSSDTENHS